MMRRPDRNSMESGSISSGASLTLGVPTVAYARPIWKALERQSTFLLHEAVPAQLALKLRAGELTGALATPVDYARDSSHYHVLPNVCIASKGQSQTILLHFKRGLRNINTIAVDPAFTSEIVLTKIVLAEKYDIAPSFIPLPTDPDKMLHKADAALVINDPLSQIFKTAGVIDIVDEWHDLTELPYVHNFWVCRGEDISPREAMLIIDAAREAGSVGEELVTASGAGIPRERLREYFAGFTYALSEDALAGLSEFLRMIYYHGVVGDLADLKLYPLTEGNAHHRN